MRGPSFRVQKKRESTPYSCNCTHAGDTEDAHTGVHVPSCVFIVRPVHQSIGGSVPAPSVAQTFPTPCGVRDSASAQATLCGGAERQPVHGGWRSASAEQLLEKLHTCNEKLQQIHAVLKSKKSPPSQLASPVISAPHRTSSKADVLRESWPLGFGRCHAG